MKELHLDRLSCSPLKPAKDWLRMMPLGPPGEKDWDPTSMISGSLVGSRWSRRLRILSLHGLFLIQCNREGNTMVPKQRPKTS